MRSLVLSLVLLAGASAHAAAQRPGITRPIQQAREAAAKSGARTAAAEAAGQEPAVRRDSVPVTAAPAISASKPGTTPTQAAAPANSKAAAPANAVAPAPKPADSMRANTKAPTSTKAPASTKAAAPAGAASATSDKSGSPVPPPQAGTGRTAPGAAKAPAASAVTPDAKAVTPGSRADSTAATVSVGSSAPTRPEIRIDREVFTYDAGGRRDPFVSLLSTSDLRPLFSDLLLVVINYDPQRRNSVAIMRDATTKEQYRVRQGQLIGRMRVAAIEQKRVLFTIDEFGFSRQESLVIGDTTKVRKQ